MFRLQFPRLSVCFGELIFRSEMLVLDVSEPLAQFRHLLLVLLDLFQKVDVVCAQSVMVRSQCPEGGFEI